jgi:hypothetical protein
LSGFKFSAGFGGVNKVGQFAGGDIVVADGGILLGVCGEVLVEAVGGFAEEGIVVASDASVGVKLDEDPRRAVLDEGADLGPEEEAIKGGRISAGEVGVFDAGDEAKLSAMPV